MRDVNQIDLAARIRELNDLFRTTLEDGIVMLTPGVQTFPAVLQVLEGAQKFTEFSAANDPYGEHDFGAFVVCGQKFFFKIDYFDHTLERGSEDPGDPSKTIRVLTVMLASEY